jgi:hypothetical protein
MYIEPWKLKRQNMTFAKTLILTLVLPLWFLGNQVNASPAAQPVKITLPALPYEKNALEPYITQKTLEFHYDKHHKGYVDNLNGLIAEKNSQDP